MHGTSKLCVAGRVVCPARDEDPVVSDSLRIGLAASTAWGCSIRRRGAFFRSWTPSSGRWSAAPLGPGRSCSGRGLRRGLCSWGCLLRPATARESEEGVAHRNLLHGILAVFFFRFDGIMTAVEPASSSSPGGTSARRPATAT